MTPMPDSFVEKLPSIMRIGALESIGALGYAARGAGTITEMLMQILQNEHEDPPVRLSAIRALEALEVGGEGMTLALANRLCDSVALVGQMTQQLLAKPSFSSLLHRWVSDQSSAEMGNVVMALEILSTLNDRSQELQSSIAHHLQHGKKIVRIAAAESVRRLRFASEPTLHTLVAALIAETVPVGLHLFASIVLTICGPMYPLLIHVCVRLVCLNACILEAMRTVLVRMLISLGHV